MVKNLRMLERRQPIELDDISSSYDTSSVYDSDCSCESCQMIDLSDFEEEFDNLIKKTRRRNRKPPLPRANNIPYHINPYFNHYNMPRTHIRPLNNVTEAPAEPVPKPKQKQKKEVEQKALINPKLPKEKPKKHINKQTKKHKKKKKVKKQVEIVEKVEKSGFLDMTKSFFSNMFGSNEVDYEELNGLIVFNRENTFNALADIRSKYSETIIQVFSWNILADKYLKSSRTSSLYSHCNKKSLEWKFRLRLISRNIIQSESDIICLQEVEREAFDLFLKPLLFGLGYEGQLHCSIMKNNELPGVATFYRTSKFNNVEFITSFRALITVLTVRKGKEKQRVGVVNCHLEANPSKSTERLNQLKSCVKKLKKQKGLYYVVVGDFNSNLDNSGRSKELSKLVEKEGFKDSYSLKSNLKDASCLLGVTKDGVSCKNMVDHILVNPNQVEVVGVTRIFDTNWNRSGFISTGLPSLQWPSDHLSIATTIRLKQINKEESTTELKVMDLESQVKTELTSDQWINLRDIVKKEKRVQKEVIKSGRKLDKTEIEKLKSQSEEKKEFLVPFSKQTQQLIKKYIKRCKAK